MIRQRMKRRIRHALAILLTVVFVLYLVVPLVFQNSKSLQKYVVFLNSVNSWRDVDFTRPDLYGLHGTRNFYLKTSDGINLGVWHILPHDSIDDAPVDSTQDVEEWYESALAEGSTVVLYLHGNKPSRATPHRVAMYNVLQKLQFHVISFDYRGFADSTDVEPTEDGLVNDAITIYNYIQEKTKHDSVYLWGHSLGTGVAVHASARLCREGNCPAGIILEAPFNKLADEIKAHPLSLPYRWWAGFNQFFVAPLLNEGIEFDSESHIRYVTCPLLILHAADDQIIPFSLGWKLYRAALGSRPPRSAHVQFVPFEADHGYGHKNIYKDPGLPETIQNFISNSAS